MALRRKGVDHGPLPAAALTAAVMGAGRGSGRSTVAALIAAAFSEVAVVLDPAPRTLSPWPDWAAHTGTGLGSIPPDQPSTTGTIRGAASRVQLGDRSWAVLTDARHWGSAPLMLPQEPVAWRQLATAGGWKVAVVDTPHTVPADLHDAAEHGATSLTARWHALPGCASVWVMPTHHTGILATQRALADARTAGIDPGTVVVAAVDTGDGKPPPAIRAGMTMVQATVAEVVPVPYSTRLRAAGPTGPAPVPSPLVAAGHALALAALRVAGLSTQVGATAPPPPASEVV